MTKLSSLKNAGLSGFASRRKRLKRKNRRSLLEILEPRRVLISGPQFAPEIDNSVTGLDVGDVVSEAYPISISPGENAKFTGAIYDTDQFPSSTTSSSTRWIAVRNALGSNVRAYNSNSIVDRDVYSVPLQSGQSLSVDIDAQYRDAFTPTPFIGDTFVRIFDESGASVAFNDDATSPDDIDLPNSDSYLQFVAPSTGIYYIAVSSAALENDAVSHNPPTATSFDAGNFVISNTTIPFDYELELTLGHVGGQCNPVSPGMGEPSIESKWGRGIRAGNSVATEGDQAAFSITTGYVPEQYQSSPFIVCYSTRKWSADSGDYESVVGEIEFAPGQSTQTIFIETSGDWLYEKNERFFLDVQAPWGERAMGQGIIVEDPGNVPEIRISDVKVVEGETASFEISVLSDRVRQQAFTLTYQTKQGFADSADFVETSGTIEFAPNEYSKTVAIETFSDWKIEQLEEFFLVATTQFGQRYVAVGEIEDDTSVIPSVHFESPCFSSSSLFQQLCTPTYQPTVFVEEGQTAELSIVLDEPQTSPIAVEYWTFDGGISSGDFEPLLGVVTFAPGELVKTIEVEAKADWLTEDTERFFVQMKTPWGTYDEATVTIHDRMLPSVSVSNLTVAGGDVATFSVTMEWALEDDITVSYATESDITYHYEPISGTVTFAAGETEKQITVNTIEFTGSSGGSGGYGGGSGGYGGGSGGYGGGSSGYGGSSDLGDLDFFFNAETPWGKYDRGRAIVTNPGSTGSGVGDIVAVDETFNVDYDRHLRLHVYSGGAQIGNVLNNDYFSGGGGGFLRAVLVNGPSYGYLRLYADGEFQYVRTDGNLGSDTFTYYVEDSNGTTSNVATATINVGNAAPNTNSELIEYPRGHINSVANLAGPSGLLENDTDTSQLVVTPMRLGFQTTGAQNFIFTSGSFVFSDSSTSFVSSADRSYSVSDTRGLASVETYSLSHTVTDAIANDDFGFTFSEGSLWQSYSSSILANDISDGSVPLLPIGASNWPVEPSPGLPSDPIRSDHFANGGTSILTEAGGKAQLFRDGSFAYQPRRGSGGTDRFYYFVSDGYGVADDAIVWLQSPYGPDPIVARDDVLDTICAECLVGPAFTTWTNPASGPDEYVDPGVGPAEKFHAWNDHSSDSLDLEVDGVGLLHNDTGGAQILSTELVGCTPGGRVNLSSNGQFSFQAKPGFIGDYEFQYSVTDGFTTALATVTIAVHGEAYSPETQYLGFTEGVSATQNLGAIWRNNAPFACSAGNDVVGGAVFLDAKVESVYDPIADAWSDQGSQLFVEADEIRAHPQVTDSNVFLVSRQPNPDGDHSLYSYEAIRYNEDTGQLGINQLWSQVHKPDELDPASTIWLSNTAETINGKVFQSDSKTYFLRNRVDDSMRTVLFEFDSLRIFELSPEFDHYTINGETFQPLQAGDAGWTTESFPGVYDGWYGNGSGHFLHYHVGGGVPSIELFETGLPSADISWGDGTSTTVHFDVNDLADLTQGGSFNQFLDYASFNHFLPEADFDTAAELFFGLQSIEWSYTADYEFDMHASGSSLNVEFLAARQLADTTGRRLEVVADKTYSAPGSYSVSTSIVGLSQVSLDAESTFLTPKTSIVLSSLIEAYGINASQTSLLYNGLVASFTDTITTTTAVDYTAKIDWGDGDSSYGTIASSGSVFNVSGTHLYEHAGVYQVGITVFDENERAVFTQSSITIAGPPQIFISENATVSESNSYATITVNLTHPIDAESWIDFQLTDEFGSAINAVDFIDRSGTLRFAPLQTTADIHIQLVDDDEIEFDEDLHVLLSNPHNIALLNATDPYHGQITIIDDDIGPVNDDSYVVLQRAILGVDKHYGVLANDVGGGAIVPIEASAGRPPSNGTLVLNEDGSFTYTPHENFFGIDSFSYMASDPDGIRTSKSGEVEVRVLPGLNHDPVFTTKQITDAYVGKEYLYIPAAMDIDGDLLTFSISDPDGDLDTQSAENGVLRWTPMAADINRHLTIDVTVSDGFGGSASQTVPITVHPLPGNSPPRFVSVAKTQHQIADTLGPIYDNVSPQVVRLTLGPGETISQPIEVEVTGEFPTYQPPVGVDGRLTTIAEEDPTRLAEVLTGGGTPGLLITGASLDEHTILYPPEVPDFGDVAIEPGDRLELPFSITRPNSYFDNTGTERFTDIEVNASVLFASNADALADWNARLSFEGINVGGGPSAQNWQATLPKPDMAGANQGIFVIDTSVNYWDQSTPTPDQLASMVGHYEIELEFRERHEVLVDFTGQGDLSNKTMIRDELVTTKRFVLTIGDPVEPVPGVVRSIEADPISSTGVFVNNNGTYGMSDYGILLSTGDVTHYGTDGDFTAEDSKESSVARNTTTLGIATAQTHSLLDPIVESVREPLYSEGANKEYLDTTQFAVEFELMPGSDHVSFDLVFGSEENPRFHYSQYLDAFGMFINGENIAFVDDNPISIRHDEMRLHSGDSCLTFTCGTGAIPEGSSDSNLIGTRLTSLLAPNGDPNLTFSAYLGPELGPNGELIYPGEPVLDHNGNALFDQYGDPRRRHRLEFIISDVRDPFFDSTVFVSHLRGWSDQPKSLDIITPPFATLSNLTDPITAMFGDVVQFDTAISGGTASFAYNAQIQDVLTGELISNVPISINNDYLYLAQAIDDDVDDVLTYSVQITGPDATPEKQLVDINELSGLIEWLPADVGAYEFSVRVEDGRGGSDEQKFTVVVSLPPDNIQPEITSASEVEVLVGEPLDYTLSAVDPDSESLIYSVIGPMPNGMGFDPATQSLSWTPSLLDSTDDGRNEPYEITLSVGDGVLTDEINVMVHVLSLNHAPQFLESPIQYHTIATGATPPPVSNPISVLPDNLVVPNNESLSSIISIEGVSPSGVSLLPPRVTNDLVIYPTTGSSPDNWQALVDALTLGGDAGIELVDIGGNQLIAPRNQGPSITYTSTIDEIPDFQFANGDDVLISFEMNDIDSAFEFNVQTATAGRAFGPIGAQILHPDASASEVKKPITVQQNSGGTYQVSIPHASINDDSHHLIVVEATDSFRSMSRQFFTITIGTPNEEQPEIDSSMEVFSSLQTTTGVFANDRDYFGLGRYGIALSTGDVSKYGVSMNSHAATNGNFADGSNSTGTANDRLAAITGEDFHYDVTQFDIDFRLSPGETYLYFNLVFGTEEYGTLSGNTSPVDGFGIFLDGVNIFDPSVGASAPSSQQFSSVHPDMRSVTGSELNGLLSQAASALPIDDHTTAISIPISNPLDVHKLSFLLGDGGDPFTDTTVYISNLSGFAPDQTPLTLVSEASGSIPFVVQTSDGDGFLDLGYGQKGQFGIEIGSSDTAAHYNLQVQDDTGNVHAYIPVSTANNYRSPIRVSDLDGDEVTVTLVNGPDGMFVDGNGYLQWREPIEGTFAIELSAADSYGNSTDYPFTLQVSDVNTGNSDPVIDTPAPPATAFALATFAFDVNATDPEGDTLHYYLTDAPSGMMIDEFTGELTWTPGPEEIGNHYKPSIHVYDRRGGRSSQPFEITILRQLISVNQRPTIDSLPIEDAVVGLPYFYEVEASDPENGDISYHLIYGPDGAAFVRDEYGTNTKALGWVPTLNDVGEHLFVIRVLDGNDAPSKLQYFNVSVVDLNERPQFDSDPTGIPAYIGREWIYPLNASDPNGDNVSFTLLPGFHPEGMAIEVVDDQFQVRWPDASEQSLKLVDGAYNDHGYAHVRILADDGRGGTQLQGFYIPLNENHAPVFLSNPNMDLVLGTGTSVTGMPVELGETMYYQVIAADPDHDPVTIDIDFNATNLPGASLTHHDLNGDGVQELVLEGLTANEAVDSVFHVRLIASDGPATSGGYAETFQDFEVYVLAEPDGSPRFTSTPALPAKLNEQWKYVLAARDPDHANSELIYSLDQTLAPTGMSLDGQVLTWTPTTSQDLSNGAHVVVTVSDGVGSDTQDFVLGVTSQAIQNSAPHVTSVPNGPAFVGKRWSYNIEATDAESDTLTFSFNNAPNGMSIDPANGNISWSPTVPGNYRVQILIDDGYNFTSHEFQLPVTSINHPPQILGVPWEPTYVDNLWRYELIAHDADGDNVLWKKEVVEANLPSGLTVEDVDLEIVEEVDPNTSTTRTYLQWTPATTFTSLPDEYFIKVSAHDTHGAFAEEEIGANWTVVATTDFYVGSTPVGSPVVGETWEYQIVPYSTNATSFEFSESTPFDAGFSLSPTGLLSFDATGATANSTVDAKVQICESGTTICYLYSIMGMTISEAENGNPIFLTSPEAISPGQGTAQAKVGEQWSHTIRISDAEGSLTLELDESAYAAGFTFDGYAERVIVPSFDGTDYTATLIWTPDESHDRSQPVVLSVYDTAIPTPNLNDPTSTVEAEWLGGPGYGFTQQSFIVTVSDPAVTGAPVIHSLPRQTAIIGEESSFQVIASGSGDLTYSISSPTTEIRNAIEIDTNGLVTWDPTVLYNSPITITVTDDSGLSTSQTWHGSQAKPYKLNEPPELNLNAPGPAVRDLQYEYDVSSDVFDANGDNVTYELLDLDGNPVTNGMSIDATTGLISWIPQTADELGTKYLVRVTEVAEPGDIPFTVSDTFRLRVLANAPPQVRVPSLYQFDSGAPALIDLAAPTDPIAFDPNGDPLTFSFDPNAAPSGLTISGDGVLLWNPQNEDLGRHKIQFEVADSEGAKTTGYLEIQILIPGLDHDPEIVFTPRNTIAAGFDYVHQVVATDKDGDDLTYLLIPDPVNGPPGMSMDANGLIRWLPTQAMVGNEYQFSIEVTSVREPRTTTGNSPYTVTVTAELQNDAPVIASAPKTSATFGFKYLYQAMATDADNDQVFWSIDSGPSDLEISEDGLLTWDREFSEEDLGDHQVSISATDTYFSSDTQEFTITVNSTNYAPLITTSPPQFLASGMTHVTPIGASDPDEGDLSFALLDSEGSPTNSLYGGMLSIETTQSNGDWIGELTWDQPAKDDYEFTVRVTDDRNASVDARFVVQVFDPSENSPPVIGSVPVVVALVGQPYDYQIVATDVDSNTLFYSASSGPVLPDATGIVRWNSGTINPSTADIGEHATVLVVSDGEYSTLQPYSLTVRNNQQPVIQPISDLTITHGTVLSLPVAATDNDPEDALVYSITTSDSVGVLSGPAAASIDDQGQISWNSALVGVGQYTFTVEVQDTYRGQILSTSSSNFTVDVVADIESPTITISVDGPVIKGREATIIVTAADNVSIASITDITITGSDQSSELVPYQTQADLPLAHAVNIASHTFNPTSFDPTTHAATYTISVTATDIAGNTYTSDSTEVTVHPDGNPPTVALDIPDGLVITAPINLIGSILNSDDPADDFIKYRLTATRADGKGGVILIKGTDGLVSEISNGLLGTFDTTTLDNGAYHLTLTGWDSYGNVAYARRNVEIDGQLKSGAFGLSNTDLEIPAPGIPLRVTRVYSTTRADHDLDFGHGWGFDLGQPKAEIQYAQGPVVGNGGRPMLTGSRVIITLPNGTKEGFTLEAQPQTVSAYGTAFTEHYIPVFAPDQGNTSKLFVQQGFTLVKLNGHTGGELISVSQGASLNKSYNPTRAEFGGYFQVQLEDGTVFSLDASNASDDFWVEDRNGNRVTYSQNRIYHSSGREIRIERTQGRITALIDPAGNRVEYTYANGNLATITDRTGGTTTLAYEDLDFPHHITKVTDALGRETLTNHYDDDGRLLSLEDASGESASLGFSGNLREQTTLNGDNQEVATTKYDVRGNVVEEKVPGGRWVMREYENDLVIKETQIVGQPDSSESTPPNDLVTTYSYDEHGRLLSSTDARGNTSATDYLGSGAPRWSSDQYGNRTDYRYDDRGNIEFIHSPSGSQRFEYDDAGNVIGIFRKTDGEYVQVVENKYNSLGELEWTRNTLTDQVTAFSYDGLGRQTHVVRSSTGDDGTQVTMTSVTLYDAEGRVTATEEYSKQAGVSYSHEYGELVSSSSTQFNLLGQVTSSTSDAGTTARNYYDLRGLQIESRTESIGHNPLDLGNPESQIRVSRTFYDSDGRAILSTSFVQSDGVSETQFDNSGQAKVSYTHYDTLGNADATYQLSGVQILVDYTDPNRIFTKIAIGPDEFDEASDGDLQAWLVANATVLSKTTSSFDSQGRVVSSTDRYGMTTQYTYNPHGEQTETRRQVRIPEGSPANTVNAWMVSRSVYDGFGRPFVSSSQFLVLVDAGGNETISGDITATFNHYDDQGRNNQVDQLSNVSVDIDEYGRTTLASGSIVESSSQSIFDELGQVKRSISNDGLITDYEYDSFGRQIASVGPRVKASEVTDINASLGVSQEHYVRVRTETEFDSLGRTSRSISNVIQVEDASGAVIGTIRDLQRYSKPTYDAFGNVVRTTYNDGSFVEYRFNEKGQQIAESQQLDAAYVTLWSDTEQSFIVDGWDEDAVGPDGPDGPDGGVHPTTILRGSDLHDVIPLHAPIPTKLYEYDSQGRIAAVHLPAVKPDANASLSVRPVYKYGYDAAGNQNLIVDPLGRETRFTFDENGRQLTRTLPFAFGEDGNANSAELVAWNENLENWYLNPGAGGPTHTEYFTYDEYGRQKLHRSFEGIVTENIYDDPSDPLNPDGTATGRLVAKNYYQQLSEFSQIAATTPDEVWTYEYDYRGRQTSAELFRKENEQLTSQRVETSLYDDGGRLWVSAGPEGVLEYKYDDDGRQESVSIRPADVALPASGAGFLTPPERITSYQYDAFGRLSAVIEDSTPTDSSDDTLDTAYAYTLSGSLGRTELPGGIVESYSYDDLGRLDVMSNTFVVSGTNEELLLAQYDYSVRADGKRDGLVETFWFDGNGNGEKEEDEDKVTSYRWSYDDAGRLVDEVMDHWDDQFDQTESFIYDLTGNRLELNRDLGNDGDLDSQTSYDYDANDRLLTETYDDFVDDANDTTTTYGYDNTQNTSKTVVADATQITRSSQLFSYNLQGRLNSVVNEMYDGAGDISSRTRTRYEYDSKSYRVKLINEDGTGTGLAENETWTLETTTEFLADHNNHTGYTQTIRETTYDQGNVVKTVDYTFGQDEIAQTITEAGQTTTHVFGHDGHGSVRVIYDLATTAAAIAQAFTFAPYGEMIAVHDSYTASIAVTARLSSLGYSGEHFDAQAQQQYLRARFYDPTNGRFNRLDPFAGNMQDPQSLHKYSYVHGDPIGNSDPSGLMSLGSVSVAVGIGGAALTLGYNISKGFAYGFEGEYSPTNIAKKTTLAFALGFGFTYAIGWWATLAVSGGASVAVVKAAVAGMTLPGIAMLTIANYVEAEKHGDEIDQYFAKLDILLLAVGGTRAARAKLAPLKPRNRIRTFRIEGDPNTRIHIDEAGNVMIIEPDKTLYLTFGDEVRAQQYLAQKLGPGQKLGPLPNGRAKSFEVTQEFVDKIRADAVTEQQLSLDPSLKGRPLVADPTKTADSFGLRPDQIKELEKVIVQGTGQDPHTFGNGGS